MAELADIAAKASRLAGDEARAAGIKVAGIDLSDRLWNKSASEVQAKIE